MPKKGKLVRIKNGNLYFVGPFEPGFFISFSSSAPVCHLIPRQMFTSLSGKKVEHSVEKTYKAKATGETC